MIQVIEAYTRSGKEWCTCCSKQANTKRINFSQNGVQGISVVLCDDCRKELIKVVKEIDNSETE